MPKDNLRWQIQDAIERANEKAKIDKMESDLAGGLAILLLPIILPIMFGIVVFGVAFGIPTAILVMVYILIFQAINNFTLAAIINLSISVLLCGIDINLIKKYSTKLKASGKNTTLIYMKILIAVPLVAFIWWPLAIYGFDISQSNYLTYDYIYTYKGGNESFSERLENSTKTNPSQPLSVGESWNNDNVVFLLEDVSFSTRSITINNFAVYNDTPNMISLSLADTEQCSDFFKLIDSNGKSYQCVSKLTPFSISPNEYEVISFVFKSNEYFFDEYFEIGYSRIKYFLLTVNGLFGINKADWMIDVIPD